jgi:putative peptidoglycan lipid II flippase
MASDIGILMHTVVLAWLLQRKGLVPLRGLPWLELGKVFATATFAGVVVYAVSRRILLHGSLANDLLAIAVIGVTWLAAAAIGLWITKSGLPRELRRRKSPAPGTAASGPETDRSSGPVGP